ncbi:MAG: DUF1684 domain-containing protein [Ignavibacteriaceae bacterium]|nr:DUF1684 domain-containing protein [Ignavibacteriaceae bacterium]
MLSRKSLRISVMLFLSLLVSEACKEKRVDDPEMKNYIETIIKERKEKDYSFQFDLNSPFNRDTTAKFKPLRYYEPNPDFIFKSKLIRYDVQDTVAILGTRGETRPAILIGYLELRKDDKVHKINVYKSFSRTGEPYYSIWFTDRTTGKETYGVGRYLDFELNDDPEFVYTIDFNRAFNPYCAYSSLFTCPIPRVEDYIDMDIEAGEKNFH